MLYEIFRLWESCPVRLRGMQNPCSRSDLARGIMLMVEKQRGIQSHDLRARGGRQCPHPGRGRGLHPRSLIPPEAPQTNPAPSPKAYMMQVPRAPLSGKARHKNTPGASFSLMKRPGCFYNSLASGVPFY